MLKTIHQLVRIFTTIIAIFMATSINTETKAQTKPQEEQNESKIMIYQVLPRLYGNKTVLNKKDGSISENGCGKMNDFTDKELERIKSFGFTHIWYTGLLEHATQTDYSSYGINRDHPAVVKGKAGSPYAVKDYYDIDPDLAVDVEKRMKEFEALVKRTHKSGLKMIMDFIPNHVARQYKSDKKPSRVKDLGENDDTTLSFSANNNFYYITGQPFSTNHITEKKFPDGPYKEYPAKATGNDQFTPSPSVNDWYETIKLNYGVDYIGGRSTHFYPVPDTWKKMTAILKFWAKKGSDGFRCDMAEMVPCEFWHYAIAEVKKSHPEVKFIAEIYNPNEYRNYIHHGGFDYLYDKVGLYDTLRCVMTGQSSASSITGCWQSVDDIQEHMLNFLENHDEQRIASDFFAGDAKKGKGALVVSACMNTNPMMIYAGQELGETAMEEEGFSGRDGRTTIFDYWGVKSLQLLQKGYKSFSEEEKELYNFYQKVITLCNQEPAIKVGKFYDLMHANYNRENNFNHDKHYAFLRKHNDETLLIVVNFCEESNHVGVRIPENAFSYLQLKNGKHSAIDLISEESQTIEIKSDCPTFVTIPGHGAVILKF